MKKNILLTLLAANSLSAQTVIWEREDIDNTNIDLVFTSPTSGVLDLDLDPCFDIGFRNSPTGPAGSFGIIPPNFMGPGEFVAQELSFAATFTDAAMGIRGAWQFNDYTLEIVGGTGTFDTSAVTMGDNSNQSLGTAGVDFQIIGDGTQSITFNSLNGDMNFYGALAIEGTWSGMNISQNYNPEDNPGFNLSSLDSHAYLDVCGITDVTPYPEPSTSLLAIISLLSFVNKRRR